MTLTEADIKAFIEMWRAEFGETLPSDIARAEAMRLLDFFAALRRGLPPQDGTTSPPRDTMAA